jgi:hypothetical protein
MLILVRYKRIPRKVTYQGYLSVGEEVRPGEYSIKDVSTVVFSSVPLEHVIENIHTALQDHRDAKVVMRYETPSGREKLQELDTVLRDMIRDDLPAATRLFAPIQVNELTRTFL